MRRRRAFPQGNPSKDRRQLPVLIEQQQQKQSLLPSPSLSAEKSSPRAARRSCSSLEKPPSQQSRQASVQDGRIPIKTPVLISPFSEEVYEEDDERSEGDDKKCEQKKQLQARSCRFQIVTRRRANQLHSSQKRRLATVVHSHPFESIVSKAGGDLSDVSGRGNRLMSDGAVPRVLSGLAKPSHAF